MKTIGADERWDLTAVTQLGNMICILAQLAD